MVEINLLPWRIYQDEYIKNKNKQLALAMLLFSISIWVILHFVFIYQSKIEKQVIYYLHKQILNESSQTKLTDEKSFENITALFQRNRLHVIDFFRRITKDNEGIYWNTMLTQDDQIILTGKTNSYQTLLTFIYHCNEEKNPFVMDIIKIKQSSESDMLEFSLHVYQAIYPLPKTIPSIASK